MSSEWRPRIRVSRKRPVTRKGNVIVVVCKDDADAEAVAAFLETMFVAARRDEAKAKAAMDQMKLDAQVTALVGAELKPGESLEPDAQDAEFTPAERVENNETTEESK